MATSYKTPGVYVEEIAKFPPSVAEVETAIPAFIGFTAQAKKILDGDLKEKPTRITSLLEYEQYFGQGPDFIPGKIELDSNNMPVADNCMLTNSKFLLYDSIHLYYDNGGGACYIVSVGTFGETEATLFADNTRFITGLDALKKYDEPTLIVFPEAVGLSTDSLGALQQAALLQCAGLGDRFTIMDVKKGASLEEDMESFRNSVGMNNLKYGAAYYPYLSTIYSKSFRFRDINSKLTVKNRLTPTDVDENGTTIISRIESLEKVITDNDNLTQEFADTLSTLLNESDFKELSDDDKSKRLWSLILQLDGKLATNGDSDTSVITNSELLTAAAGAVKINLLDTKIINQLIYLNETNFNTVKGNLQSTSFKSLEVPSADPGTGKGFMDIFKAVKICFSLVVQMGSGYEETYEKAIIPYIPFYNNVLSVLNTKATLLPPSGAIAGIYSAVDRDRGVWKAPANISVNSVNGVSEFINDAVQENMNVDPNAGKSINAIRPFTGKGILVWGSRTLAGNDNEWRYVPVRRFFNFVEESAKKSTGWAVFEANDANTWTRIRGQLDNFLNNLWKRGALAGAKPEHAYYVNVGLGLTMTAQDVLEGRMIVEIGMAAVRPAEFIILRFSHKLQES